MFAATGGTPRMLTVPGADLENVLYLRYPEDANKIGW
jgi:NAD(P)H-nitrite reductase